MRTVKHLPNSVAKETDLIKFPDSTVVNENDLSDGTPVVREIYGDVLTNIYKILRLTKIVANGDEDNETDGYQLVDALRKFTNNLNDVEQQLNLTGLMFSVNLDLDLLPNRYVCIVRAVEDYISTNTYQFKGTGDTALPFTAPNPFKSGDVVLLIIDTAGVRAYSLLPKAATEVINELYTPFGTPVAFNNADKMYYQEEGVLMTDTPEVFDMQAFIRFAASDGTLLVYELLVVSGYVYALVFAPNTLQYSLYRAALTNLNVVEEVSISGASFPVGEDRQPNIYTNGNLLYITNATGNDDDDGLMDIFSFDHNNNQIIKTGTVTLTDFNKSTNTVVNSTAFYDLVNNQLYKYSLADGAKTLLATYPGYLGVLFAYKNDIYFTTGEVAKLWHLPI